MPESRLAQTSQRKEYEEVDFLTPNSQPANQALTDAKLTCYLKNRYNKFVNNANYIFNICSCVIAAHILIAILLQT